MTTIALGWTADPFGDVFANSLLHFVQESGLPHVPVVSKNPQVTPPLLVASRYYRLLRR